MYKGESVRVEIGETTKVNLTCSFNIDVCW